MRFQPIVAAALVAATLGTASIQPANANGAASTRNIILGAAALVAGFAIESNIHRKHQLANGVEGYLPNGATVYYDGHVVAPDGQSYYPANYGQTVVCNGTACTIDGGNSYGNGYNGQPPFAQNRRAL
ncbi:MAG: hypothetical protein ACREM8_13420 [Vulcanimicrobiaceae bacterium]